MNLLFWLGLIGLYFLAFIALEQINIRAAVQTGKVKRYRIQYLIHLWVLMFMTCFTMHRLWGQPRSIFWSLVFAGIGSTILFFISKKMESQSFNLKVGEKLASSLPHI